MKGTVVYLFAFDVANEIRTGQVRELLGVSYDECAGAIWEHDGLLNKTIGDAVIGIFNFPITRPDHARQALLAARELQQRCAARKAAV